MCIFAVETENKHNRCYFSHLISLTIASVARASGVIVIPNKDTFPSSTDVSPPDTERADDAALMGMPSFDAAALSSCRDDDDERAEDTAAAATAPPRKSRPRDVCGNADLAAMATTEDEASDAAIVAFEK